MTGQKRFGRLQRGVQNCFWEKGIREGTPEAYGSDLAEWCRPEAIIVEKRRLADWERDEIARAAKSFGAYRLRRDGREWLWRMPDGWDDEEGGDG